jgi:hypothetical protein
MYFRQHTDLQLQPQAYLSPLVRTHMASHGGKVDVRPAHRTKLATALDGFPAANSTRALVLCESAQLKPQSMPIWGRTS